MSINQTSFLYIEGMTLLNWKGSNSTLLLPPRIDWNQTELTTGRAAPALRIFWPLFATEEKSHNRKNWAFWHARDKRRWLKSLPLWMIITEIFDISSCCLSNAQHSAQSLQIPKWRVYVRPRTRPAIKQINRNKTVSLIAIKLRPLCEHLLVLAHTHAWVLFEPLVIHIILKIVTAHIHVSLGCADNIKKNDLRMNDAQKYFSCPLFLGLSLFLHTSNSHSEETGYK